MYWALLKKIGNFEKYMLLSIDKKKYGSESFLQKSNAQKKYCKFYEIDSLVYFSNLL